ncbi:MAG: aldehyde dehydrogenase family protein [Rhodovulum sp.]
MTVSDLMESMDYGTASESPAQALAWLVDRGDRFGHFIEGRFTPPGEGFEARNPATGEVLATLTQATDQDLDAAVAAARKAQPSWAALPGHSRARHLYGLARLIQKQARLIAVLETLDNGKPLRESRDIDVPLAARHFYYHAGLAQLLKRELPDHSPLGVCGQIIPWNFPFLMLAWKIAPALAAGNAVVLKPAEQTSLTALLFAELTREAGLPAGVVNIVTGDGTVGERIVSHPGIDKIAFTGSTEVGRKIREATAGSRKALSLELGGKSPYIVFDDADLDSAVEGLVDAIWFNQGQVCCAGSRLIVQEGIADTFHDRLKTRMAGLRMGDPLDKCIDIGAIIDEAQRSRIEALVAAGLAEGEMFQPDCALPDKGCFYPPTLITGLSPASPLMQEEIFGPVLVSTTFRTPAEAVQLANDTRYGLAASVWSETIGMALDVAPRLAAGVIWVNGSNMFDAAAEFGGLRESGFGREGGWEGLMEYLRPAGTPKPLEPLVPPARANEPAPADPLDRTAKLYIGGKQTRPDGGYTRAVYGAQGRIAGHVGLGNRKDIRNAVEAARKAQIPWAETSAHTRAQIIYYIAENLSARAEWFAGRLLAITGAQNAMVEVEASIDRLFTWAAWADKYAGEIKAVPIRGTALAMNRPVGVIGALCPDDSPLLGLVSVMAPAIAMGNTVVIVPSEPFPLAATDFYQVLDTSDLPGGVVNMVTGAHSTLAGPLASHMDVDAIWSFSSSDASGTIERAAAGNLKRTWVNYGNIRDWMGDEGEGRAFLRAATEVKTVWIPWGA